MPSHAPVGTTTWTAPSAGKRGSCRRALFILCLPGMGFLLQGGECRLHQKVQLLESLEGNNRVGDNDRVKGLGVTHPRRDQRFGHVTRQSAVVLDPMQGVCPVNRKGLSSEWVKRIVKNQLLSLMMGSMQ